MATETAAREQAAEAALERILRELEADVAAATARAVARMALIEGLSPERAAEVRQYLDRGR